MAKEASKRVYFESIESVKLYLGDFSRGDPYDNHSKYEEQPSLVSPPHNKKLYPDGKSYRNCRDPHASASARSQNHPSTHHHKNKPQTWLTKIA